MAPITPASDETNHQALLDALDVQRLLKPFRSPRWRAPQRRNKAVRQMLTDAARREHALVAATATAASASASALPSQPTSGDATPLPAAAAAPASASRTAAAAAQRAPAPAQAAGDGVSSAAPAPAAAPGPAPTYSNIEAPPSLRAGGQRRYCDVTGLRAPYTDPKTRLRYHDREVFALIRTLPTGTTESYLSARGAHTVLK